MAIIQGIITVRLGKESELNTSKLLSGEFGFTTDTKKLFIGTSAGAKEIAFQGEVSGSVTDEQIQEAVNKYLEENPIVSSDLYMRVDSGYIQFSQDNKNWKNVIAVEELTGPRGVGVGEVVQTGISNEPDGVNEITILMTDGEIKKFYVKNGSSGSDGVGIEKIEQTVITNEPGDENEITVTLTDGREERFYVYNGKAGVNGAKGETGVGISTVKQTTTSSSDGGTNVITVTKTDGSTSTFSVKNGSKGSTGAPGKDGSDASVTTANIKTALGYTPAKQTDVDNLSQEIGNYLPKNQGASNVGKILVVGTDGNLTLTDMPEGGTSGDVTGVLDESNNILLSGNLADGTYTLVFVDAEGNTTGAGTLEVSAIVTYTVTQNLTEVTSDYSATEVRNGESITVNLTANSGYNLKSITVTMGGADITSTSVSGSKVTIASVTGDVVITAVAEEIKVIEPVTVDITLTDGIRIGSDGTDRTLAGYCATPHIDLTNIPKPCTIHLTKARWIYATSSETGTIMYYATKVDGTKLVGGYTNDTIGSGYFNVVRNNGKNTDVTVTVTSNEVAKIRFSGNWSSSEVRDDYGFADWDTNMHAEATLTYTPES